MLEILFNDKYFCILHKYKHNNYVKSAKFFGALMKEIYRGDDFQTNDLRNL